MVMNQCSGVFLGFVLMSPDCLVASNSRNLFLWFGNQKSKTIINGLKSGCQQMLAPLCSPRKGCISFQLWFLLAAVTLWLLLQLHRQHPNVCLHNTPFSVLLLPLSIRLRLYLNNHHLKILNL